MRRWIGLMALGTAVLLLGAACSSSSDEEKGGTITINGDKANDHGTKDVSGNSFELEADNDGSDFYFDPTTLKGSPGAKVTLTVGNEGDVKHNFTLEDQGVDEDVDAGEDVEVTVTFPQSGTLEFYCKYHRTQGMVGQLQAS